MNVIIQQTEQHFFKQLFIKGAVSFDNDTVFLPVSSNGIQLWRISNNGDPALRIRDGTAQWIYVNNNLKCTNANTEDGNIMILNDNSAANNSNRMRLGSLTSAEVGIGKANESGYFLSVGRATKVDSLEVDNNITMNGDTITATNSNGIEIYKDTTDASPVLEVKNAQGYIRIHSFNINAYNTSNNSPSLLLLNTVANAGVCCFNLGIGVIAGSNRLSVGGGNSNFGGTASCQGASTFNNSILVSGGGSIYQQANANNSLNITSVTEQNFSLQSNRNADPTQSDIYINLNTSNGITLNKATVFNDTVDIIGKLTCENGFDVDIGATGTPEFRVLGSSVNFLVLLPVQIDYQSVVVIVILVARHHFKEHQHLTNSILVSGGGRIYQQANANNSLNIISLTEQNFSLQSNRNADPTQSDIYTNLNTSNGITLNKATVFNDTVDIIGKLTCENGFDVDIGATGTPEFRVLGSSVNFFEKCSITHTQLAGPIDQIFFRNPDTNGQTITEIGTKNVLTVNDGGIDVIGDISYTGSIGPSSDKRLKEGIKEINRNKAVELVKYIVPKTYQFIDKEKYGDKCHCGFIANDFFSDKMPSEWSNIVREGRDGYLRFDYSMTTPLLWSALQHALNEIDEMKDLFKTMKKEMATMKGEITKLKNNGKGKGEGK